LPHAAVHVLQLDNHVFRDGGLGPFHLCISSQVEYSTLEVARDWDATFARESAVSQCSYVSMLMALTSSAFKQSYSSIDP
jgi:hypothetical protein